MKIVLKGGPGSGHHGHRGRPGLVGGGLPEGASAAHKKTLDDMRNEISELLKSRPAYESPDYDNWLAKFSSIIVSYKPAADKYGTDPYLDPEYRDWIQVNMELQDLESRRQIRDSNTLRKIQLTNKIVERRSTAPKSRSQAIDALMKNGFDADEAETIADILKLHPDGFMHAAWIERTKAVYYLEGIGTAAASYDSTNDVILIHDGYFNSGKPDFMIGAMYHEISHMKWDRIMDPAKLLTSDAKKRSKEVLSRIRQLDASRKGFSVGDANLLSKVITAGKSVSSYSAKWWKRYDKSPNWQNLTAALNETFSEMQYLSMTGRSTVPSYGMDWYQDIFREMNSLYDADLRTTK